LLKTMVLELRVIQVLRDGQRVQCLSFTLAADHAPLRPLHSPSLSCIAAIMSSEEKMRSSVDAARDPAQPVLPTVNPDALKSPEPASFHPAVYIA
jgi:hypothetical protein